MSQETLKSAARRAVRYFNIDMNAGGLITRDTEIAMLTLNKMVERSPEYDLIEEIAEAGVYDAIPEEVIVKAARLRDGN